MMISGRASRSKVCFFGFVSAENIWVIWEVTELKNQRKMHHLWGLDENISFWFDDMICDDMI